MITYSIFGLPPEQNILRLGFSVWARSKPKDYLSTYPTAIKELENNVYSKNISLYALVDDIWPRIILSRTEKEQKRISNDYKKTLPELGFSNVILASDFMRENVLEECLGHAKKITISEFWKLLPKSKKADLENLFLSEILGFFWHIEVLKVAFEKFKLNGFLAGIRSEFFYLKAQKFFPPHNIYFINTI